MSVAVPDAVDAATETRQAGAVMRTRTLPPYRNTMPGELLATHAAIMASVRPLLRRLDLTEPQWRTLRALDAGGTDPKQLAAITMLNPPSLTRIMKELVERGLIERETDPDDRRRAIVRIMPHGRDHIARMTDHATRLHIDLRDRFGRARFDTLLGELRALEAIATMLVADHGKAT